MPGGVVEDHDGAPAAQVGPPQRDALADGVGYLRGRHREHPEQPAQRLSWAERTAPWIMGMKVEVERPVRVLPGDQAGRADRQRGLSHARHPLDDGDPRGASVFPGEQPEFLAAAHEFRRLGRKGVRRCRPARALAGGPGGQPGITAEDALMKLGQHRPRFCALFLNEAAAGLPVEAQRIGWPAASVKGGHLMGDERFIQRVLGQQMAKLTDQVGVLAEL